MSEAAEPSPQADAVHVSKTASNTKKVQQLLLAVAAGPIEDTSQLNKLDDFTKRSGKKIAQKFSGLCHGDFDVTIDSVTQHFANELIDQALDSKQNDYYLAFGIDEDHPCGFISIPLNTAFVWATQLLGDTESEEDPDRDFSQLEESLLFDVGTAIVEAISESNTSCNFVTAKNIVRRLLPLELEGTEELCRITFTLKSADEDKAQNPGQAHLFMLSNKLEPIVGKAGHAADEFSGEDISKAILYDLRQTSVSVTAQLACALLTFEQLMDLRVGDTLVLDKKIDEPMQLIVEGRTTFHGMPAQSEGKYAVVITESQEHAPASPEAP
ncbi:MAG: FliM/FliN family flagellar motor switch protein [Planctomycetota bacterium]|jgi:flagellar motor switch protein FliM